LIITCLLALALTHSITRIRRVCPSIFNCQRPQMFHTNCKFERNDGKAGRSPRLHSKWR